MTKHEAIMAAADFIERNPERYKYMATTTPDSGGGCQACMWGWVGRFMGMPAGIPVTEVARLLGEIEHDLYMFAWNRVNVGSKTKWNSLRGAPDEIDAYAEFVSSATNAVSVMRAYAKRFAPLAKLLDPAYLAFRDALNKAREAA